MMTPQDLINHPAFHEAVTLYLSPPRREPISSWHLLNTYLAHKMALEPREQFRVLFLDKRNCLIADEVMGHGTVDHAPVYPREVARRALEWNASAVILAHNHPSGDPTPSAPDVDMTKRVRDALATLGIVIHDHVVVGTQGVTSFKATGLL